MPKPQKPKPEPKRSWVYDPGTSNIYCYPSSVGDCIAERLWQAGRSPFHDDALQKATDAINSILDRVHRGNKDQSRHLAFIDVQSQLLLVWTRHRGIVGSDDDAELAKALKIKGFNTR